MARTGRPKALNPMSSRVNINLSADESRQLEAYCAKHGTTKSEVARRGIRYILQHDHAGIETVTLGVKHDTVTVNAKTLSGWRKVAEKLEKELGLELDKK